MFTAVMCMFGILLGASTGNLGMTCFALVAFIYAVEDLFGKK